MLREMAAAAIRTSRLTKDYGRGRGLFDLDLQIPEQEVFGYLGPNGSGKTTTIRLLMGMIRATGGAAHLFWPASPREFAAGQRGGGYPPAPLCPLAAPRVAPRRGFLGG